MSPTPRRRGALSELEEFELEPSLGNGGLGRLAACFLDSLATLGLPADGLGLAYHCGLFRQSFVDRQQTEAPDHWLKWGQESWMRRTDVHYDIPFGDFTARSTLYEIDVTGYQGKCGRLRLFDVDTADERLIKSGIGFDARDVARGLTLFLYPDDSTEQGRLLRVYQEYFMVANAARLILDECVARGSDLHDLAAGEVAAGISGEGRAPADARHRPAGRPGVRQVRRSLRADHRRTGERSHGEPGHPLHPLRQWRGEAAHGDPEELGARALLRHLSGEVQQQDQRHHLPPLADAPSPRSSGPTSGASPIGCGGTRVPSSTRTACSMCSRSASTSTSASS